MPGVVDTTHVFATNQVITSTLMNNIIDETTFTSQALAAGTSTLALIDGRMKVATGGIAANELATDAVTNTKIKNDAVTTSKISDDAVTTAKILDDNVTTAKIADASITATKIAYSNFPIQVIQAVKTDIQQFTSNLTDFVDITGLSVTLTRNLPSSSGKILIQGVVNTDTNNSSHGVAIRIQRDGVTIGVGDAEGIRQRATSRGSHASTLGGFPVPINFLDESPGSGATVTYKLQARSANSVVNFINRSNTDTDNSNQIYRTISTLTLTELSP